MAITEKNYVEALAFQIYINDNNQPKAFDTLSEQEQKLYKTIAKHALVVGKAETSKEVKIKLMKVMFEQNCPEKIDLIPQIVDIVEPMLSAEEDIFPFEERGNPHSIPKVLEQKRLAGENVVYNLEGTLFFSCCDTIETCYLKSYGKSRKEVLKDEEKSKEEQSNKEYEYNKKLSDWKEKGKKYIYNEKHQKWENFVSKFENNNFAFVVKDALDIMELLERKVYPLDIYDYVKNLGSWSNAAMEIVAEYSKYGPEFFRKVMYYSNHSISSEKEKELQLLESQNSEFSKSELNQNPISR